MKKLILLAFTFCVMANVIAQNSEGKADDTDRIAITPQISDQAIPQEASDMLLSKMKQICTKNGMAGDTQNPFFIMDATVNVLSKELTPTAPPMHALSLQVAFFIKDAVNGNVYSETSIEVKGVGKNETKAYLQALKNINISSGQFKSFVDKGKSKIIQFYNADCDFVISKANALKKQGNNAEALKVLNSVPKVCLECYDKCMTIASEIEPPVQDTPNTSVQPGDDGNDIDAANPTQMEVAEGVYITYNRCKVLGQKLILHLSVENTNNKDYELELHNLYKTRIIDNNGEQHEIIVMRLAGKENRYNLNATLLPGVPVQMECEFDLVDEVKLIEFNLNDNVFRMRNLDCVN